MVTAPEVKFICELPRLPLFVGTNDTVSAKAAEQANKRTTDSNVRTCFTFKVPPKRSGP